MTFNDIDDVLEFDMGTGFGSQYYRVEKLRMELLKNAITGVDHLRQLSKLLATESRICPVSGRKKRPIRYRASAGVAFFSDRQSAPEN